ncbi:hypothetical protein AVEN_205119-1 [Araneus ventricosus]|uniref:Gustatory receptor n=1 Tax=Araneus ventricosus TaxID=182803 RepID=A0A4Y2GC91_ARAVE|nr:hypothetical protein AVEN_205119-1 [Araneus ventricosus]
MVFKILRDELQNDCCYKDLRELFFIYGDVIQSLSSMEDNFSFLVFIAMLVSLMGMFWTGYGVILASNLTQNYLFALICSTILDFTFLLLIMISASITNESVEKTNIVVQRLPYRIPTHRNDLETKIRKDFSEKIHLTFWKISVFDRSFVFTCFGTLLTYGILIATLGKQ